MKYRTAFYDVKNPAPRRPGGVAGGVQTGETTNRDTSKPQTHYPGAANHDTSTQPGVQFGTDAADAHATGHKLPKYPVKSSDHGGTHGASGLNRRYAYSKLGSFQNSAAQKYPFNNSDSHAGTHGRAGQNRRYAYANLGNYTGGQRTDFMKEQLPSEAHYADAVPKAMANRPSSSSFPAPETVREHSSGHGGASSNWLAVTRKGRSSVVRDTGKNQSLTQNRSFPTMPRDASKSRMPVQTARRVIGRGFTNARPQNFPSQSR